MRPLLSLLLVASFLLGCADKVPGPVAAADRLRPHVLLIPPAPSTILVDGGAAFTVPGFVAFSPAAAAGGFIGQAIVAAIEAPAAQRRAVRQASLSSLVGDTASAASVFATTFDAMLATNMRGTVELSVQAPEANGGNGQLPTGGVPVNVMRDAVFAEDGRMLIGRARVSYLPPGATGPVAFRNFLVFSEPLEAADDAQAMALWQDNAGRLLRLRAEEVARELANLVHSQLFVDPEVFPRSLNTALATLPGAGIIGATAEVRVTGPGRMAPNFLRREGSRAVLLQQFSPSVADFIWMSIPVSLLQSPRS